MRLAATAPPQSGGGAFPGIAQQRTDDTMADDNEELGAVIQRPVKPTEIAVPSPQGPGTPDWWAAAYGPTLKYLTTLDMTKPDQRRLLMEALVDETDGSAKYINADLHMVGYTMLPASKVVEDELHEWVRTVIHLEGGGRVSFGSRGIVKSLQIISQLDREPPWSPPLVKRLENHTLANGRNWLVLVDPPAAQAKGKAK